MLAAGYHNSGWTRFWEGPDSPEVDGQPVDCALGCRGLHQDSIVAEFTDCRCFEDSRDSEQTFRKELETNSVPCEDRIINRSPLAHLGLHLPRPICSGQHRPHPYLRSSRYEQMMCIEGRGGR